MKDHDVHEVRFAPDFDSLSSYTKLCLEDLYSTSKPRHMFVVPDRILFANGLSWKFFAKARQAKDEWLNRFAKPFAKNGFKWYIDPEVQCSKRCTESEKARYESYQICIIGAYVRDGKIQHNAVFDRLLKQYLGRPRIQGNSSASGKSGDDKSKTSQSPRLYSCTPQ